MPNKVKMSHPGMAGQEILVSESAVRHHQRAGWRLVEAKDEVAPGEGGVPAPEPKTSRRASQRNTEGES